MNWDVILEFIVLNVKKAKVCKEFFGTFSSGTRNEFASFWKKMKKNFSSKLFLSFSRKIFQKLNYIFLKRISRKITWFLVHLNDFFWNFFEIIFRKFSQQKFFFLIFFHLINFWKNSDSSVLLKFSEITLWNNFHCRRKIISLKGKNFPPSNQKISFKEILPISFWEKCQK